MSLLENIISDEIMLSETKLNALILKYSSVMEIVQDLGQYLKCSDHITRERSIELLNTYICYLLFQNQVNYQEMQLLIDFYISKLKDRFNIQPLAIYGLFLCVNYSKLNDTQIDQMLNQEIVTNLGINSLKEQHVDYLLSIYRRIIFSTELAQYGNKILSILVYLSENLFIICKISLIFQLIEVLKSRCENLNISCEFEIDFEKFIKIFFPMTGIYPKPDNQHVQFIRDFISAISLFRSQSNTLLNIGVENLQFRSMYVQSDALALIYKVLYNLKKHSIYDFAVFTTTLTNIIHHCFKPFLQETQITDSLMKNSDMPIRLTVLTQIVCTLVRIDALNSFIHIFESFFSQLRFGYNLESLTMAADFCCILEPVRCKSQILTIQNIISFISEHTISSETLKFINLINKTFDFYTFSDQDINIIFESMITLDIPIDFIRKACSQYQHNLLQMLLKKQLYSQDYRLIIEFITCCSPLLAINVIDTNILLWLDCFGVSDYFSLLRAIASIIKFDFILDRSWHVLSKIILYLLSKNENLDTKIFILISNICSRCFQRFEKSELLQFKMINLNCYIPNLFEKLTQYKSFEIILMDIADVYVSNCEINDLLDLNRSILQNTTTALGKYWLDTCVKIIINNISLSDIENFIIQNQVQDIYDLKMILLFIKSSLIKSIGARTDSCLRYNELFKTLSSIYFWDDDLVLLLRIRYINKPKDFSEYHWLIFVQNESLKLIKATYEFFKLSGEFGDKKGDIILKLIQKCKPSLLNSSISLNLPQIFTLLSHKIKNESQSSLESLLLLRDLLNYQPLIDSNSNNALIESIIACLTQSQNHHSFNPLFLLHCLELIVNKTNLDRNAKVKLIKTLQRMTVHPKRIIRTTAMRMINDLYVK